MSNEMITHPDFLASVDALSSLAEAAPHELPGLRRQIEERLRSYVPAPSAEEIKMSEQMGVTLSQLSRHKARLVAADRAANSLSADERKLVESMGVPLELYIAERDARKEAATTLRELSEERVASLSASCGGDVVAMAARARHCGWAR